MIQSDSRGSKPRDHFCCSSSLGEPSFKLQPGIEPYRSFEQSWVIVPIVASYDQTEGLNMDLDTFGPILLLSTINKGY